MAFLRKIMCRACKPEIERIKTEVNDLHETVLTFVKNRHSERMRNEQNIQTSRAHEGQAYLVDKLKMLSRRQEPTANQLDVAKKDDIHLSNGSARTTFPQPNHTRRDDSGADESRSRLSNSLLEPSLLD
jgi:hypothetical protein